MKIINNNDNDLITDFITNESAFVNALNSGKLPLMFNPLSKQEQEKCTKTHCGDGYKMDRS